MERGDLIIILQEISHSVYERRPGKGSDLTMVKEISLVDALCGDYFEVKTLDDRILRIPRADEVITPTTTKTIVGEGMPTRLDGRGDLHIKFVVVFPSFVSTETKEMLKKCL